jgi:hypothetical protein
MTLWQVGVGGAEPIPNADELAAARAIDPLETIITTAHQTIGASLLALIAIGVYWSKRIAKAHAPRVIRASRSRPRRNRNALDPINIGGRSRRTETLDAVSRFRAYLSDTSGPGVVPGSVDAIAARTRVEPAGPGGCRP